MINNTTKEKVKNNAVSLWHFAVDTNGRILVLLMLSAMVVFLTGDMEIVDNGKEVVVNILDHYSQQFPALGVVKNNHLHVVVGAHILSILVAFSLFLPKTKLKQAKQGLNELKINDFEDFLDKFKEIHYQIKETEDLESAFYVKISEQMLTDVIKTESQILKTDASAKTIWIASRDLSFDISESNIRSVKNNLMNGKRYTWIIPTSQGNKDNLEENTKMMVDRLNKVEPGFATKEDVERIVKNYRIVQVPGDACWMLMNDIAIYNYGEDLETAIYEFTFKDAYLQLNNKSAQDSNTKEIELLTDTIDRIQKNKDLVLVENGRYIN